MTARRIVVHTDFSEASAGAVEYARALANAFGGTLRFLRVVPEPLSAGWTAEVNSAELPKVQEAMEIEAEQWIDRVLPEDEQDRFRARLDLETGDMAEEIVRYAAEQKADIVILGASTKGGTERADTGVAEAVLRKCHCSVFVVR